MTGIRISWRADPVHLLAMMPNDLQPDPDRQRQQRE